MGRAVSAACPKVSPENFVLDKNRNSRETDKDRRVLIVRIKRGKIGL